MGGTDWEKPSRRQSRTKWPTVALVVVAVVMVGLVARGGIAAPPGSLGVEADQSSTPSPSPSPRPSPSSRPTPRSPATPSEAPLPGDWEAFPPSPLGDVTEVGLASTGNQLLVWGGARTPLSGRRTFSVDGAAFDIDRSGAQPGLFDGAWRSFPPSPLSGRTGHAMVWAGTELIVWGGQGAVEFFADGAAYDPRVERWRPLAASPLSPRAGAVAVWTGTEVMILGGWDTAGTLDNSAAYDPGTDTWRPLAPPPPGLSNAFGIQGLWDGESVVVWTPEPSPNGTGVARYHPSLDRWTSLPAPPGQQQDPLSALAWSGTELHAVRATPSGFALWSLTGDGPLWRERPPPPLRDYPSFTVWAGQQLVVVDRSLRAQLFDPVRDTWSYTSPASVQLRSPVPVPFLWTGEELVVHTGDQRVAVGYRVPAPVLPDERSCPPWSCLPGAAPEPSRIGTALTAASTAAPSPEHRTLPI